jgi:hypothetical protein
MPEHDGDLDIVQQAAVDVARLFDRPALIKVVELARAVADAAPAPAPGLLTRRLTLVRPDDSDELRDASP